MPKRLSGASCLPRTVPGAVHAVWITDNVLADAFRRFTRISRRHGSNVPGPLEARKRASKRRNTSLAHAGGGASVDPAILFSKRPRDTWWQREPEPDTVSPQSILPRWLFPPSDPPPAPELPPALELLRNGLREKISPIQEATTDTPRPSLRSDFLQCSSVEDIHELLARRNIDLRQDPVTKLFIGSLLRRWTCTNIADFLTDPEMNPPGTNHHARTMACLRSIPAESHSPWRKLEDRNIMLQALCRAIGLGLLVPKDIEDVITALPQVEISGLSEISTLPSETDVLAMTYLLLRSLRDSNVLSVQDLSLDFRNALLSRTTTASPSLASLQLLDLLSEATSQGSGSAVTERIVTWLSRNSEHGDSSTLQAVGEYLIALPKSSLAQILSTVTGLLYLSTSKDRSHMVAFAVWAEVLRSLRLPISDEALYEYSDFDPSRRAPSSERTQMETALKAYWLQHALQTSQPHLSGSELLTLDLDLQSQIGSGLSVSNDIHPLDWLVEANQVLQCLPIHDKRSVLLKLTNSVKNLLLANASQQPASLTTTKDCLQACEILADNAFYEVAKRHFKHELTRFCESITSDLTQFKDTVQSLIGQRGMTKFKVVSRAMKHNRVFQLGLAQYRRERQDWRDVLITDNIAIVRSKPYHVNIDATRAFPHDAAMRLPPAQSLLDVIDHIAVSFATNPHESAQASYNRVRQLWRFLRSHRVPAGPVITRCLWHAGIARQGSEGTSQTQLKWVSDRVRRTEGKLIARLLMSNSAFRVHRKAVLETIQKACAEAKEENAKGASKQLTEPRPQISMLSPDKQAQMTPCEPQHPTQATLADIIDWIACPKKQNLQPSELVALRRLANASLPCEMSKGSLEEQSASLERLVGSPIQEDLRYPRQL